MEVTSCNLIRFQEMMLDFMIVQQVMAFQMRQERMKAYRFQSTVSETNQ